MIDRRFLQALVEEIFAHGETACGILSEIGQFNIENAITRALVASVAGTYRVLACLPQFREIGPSEMRDATIP